MRQVFLWLTAGAITLSTSVQAEVPQTLREALTLHASFDKSFNADFSRGSPDGTVQQGAKTVPAQANDDVRLTEDSGRFGGALQFTRKSSYRPQFHGDKVLNYNDKNWSTTVSAWLKLDPDKDLEPGYCDPIQIVGGDTKQGFIFLEWSKDHTPRRFRYAIRPLYPIWNPTAVGWEEIPNEKRPMIEIQKAPFSANAWTHVAFTVENGNDKSRPRRGKLYLNGQPQGSIENWDLTFGWDPSQVRLVLGAAYVGQLDDLAVFNKALTDDEVQQVYKLPNGVADLHR